MLKADKKFIEENSTLPKEQKLGQLAGIESTKETFQSLFDPKKFHSLKSNEKNKLSQKELQKLIPIKKMK